MKKIMLILLSLTLSACSMPHQFDCPYKEGARCLSVEEIDKKIDSGEIGDKTESKKSTNPSPKSKPCHLFSCTKKEAKKIDESLLKLPGSPSALRTNETILSLWLAPFYTEDGIYHEAHRIHFVAKEAAWKTANLEMLEDTL